MYSKFTGEIVGFVDLERVNNGFLQLETKLQNERELCLHGATHVPVLTVRGLFTRLNFPWHWWTMDFIARDSKKVL